MFHSHMPQAAPDRKVSVWRFLREFALIVSMPSAGLLYIRASREGSRGHGKSSS